MNRRDRRRWLRARCVRCRGAVDLDAMLPDEVWEAATGWPSKYGGRHQEDDPAVIRRRSDLSQVLCRDCIVTVAARRGIDLAYVISDNRVRWIVPVP